MPGQDAGEPRAGSDREAGQRAAGARVRGWRSGHRAPRVPQRDRAGRGQGRRAACAEGV